MSCQICDVAGCPGENQLREFDDWADLSDHLGEAEIVTFINTLAKLRANQKRCAKRVHDRQRALLSLAEELGQLQPGNGIKR